jgi:membrane fusion protein, heavy metal efflux system
VRIPSAAPLCAMTAVVAMLLAGCGRASTSKAEAKPTRNPLEITPGPELAGQIKTGEIKWEAVSGTLRVAGRVEADETRMARVNSPLTGRIVELEVFEGELVKRGQVLATIYSAELSLAQSAFLKAYSQRQLADRAVSRARQLLNAGVIGEAELQRRESELQQASADLSACREQLGVLGLSNETIEKLESTRALNSVTHIVSSIDGMVLERKATIGQVVQAVEPVFVVADLSNVWLVADVPEQSAGAIGIGKSLDAEIPALPGVRISGTLSFVSAIVNPQTRTVRMRMNLANPERKYKPAMLANITLVDGAERRRVVPAGAVVREGNDDSLFIVAGPNTFLLRRVTLGEEFRGARVLLDGVRDGEKIVTDGAFHLNNERKRIALQGREGA